MEKVTPWKEGSNLFNSPLETGIRALIVLEAMYPRAWGLTELTWFDYLVVHTGDINGPDSLHPDLPQRKGELLVRRQLVEKSVRLMQRFHLINELHSDDGVGFIASDEAPSFVDLLHANYYDALKKRADWIATNFSELSSSQIQENLNDLIGRWSMEFIEEPSSKKYAP